MGQFLVPFFHSPCYSLIEYVTDFLSIRFHKIINKLNDGKIPCSACFYIYYFIDYVKSDVIIS